MERINQEKQMDVSKLWDAYVKTKDTAVKNQLIMHYVYIVNSIVYRMMPMHSAHSESEDLIGYGVLGLIDAIDKYDPNRNIKFESYASKRVRGEILDSMRRQDWAPASLRAKIKMVSNAYESMEMETPGNVTDEAVAKRLGMEVGQVQKTREKAYMFNVLHFETLVETKSSETFAIAETIGDDEEKQPENQLEKRETRDIIASIVQDLPENERHVIELYYYEELMLKEISKILGLSESRISQIHSKVLGKMRSQLEKIYR